jgi:hypothetical protein
MQAFALDQLDFVLLLSLTIIAVSSLVFQLDGSENLEDPFFKLWELLVIISVVVSLAAAVASVVHDTWIFFLERYIKSRIKNRVRMESQRTPAPPKATTALLVLRSARKCFANKIDNTSSAELGAVDMSVSDEIELLESFGVSALRAASEWTDPRVLELLTKALLPLLEVACAARGLCTCSDMVSAWQRGGLRCAIPRGLIAVAVAAVAAMAL